MSKTFAERFWSKVGQRLSGGCREWQGASARGYGRVYCGSIDRTVMAHHAAWFLEYGRWPIPGSDLRHLCHNRRCVAVEHLVEGTRSENQLDAARLGTHAGYKSRKLNVEQVRVIRAAPWRQHAFLAEQYGVTRSTIGRVRQRSTYRNIPEVTPRQVLLQRRRRRNGGGGKYVPDLPC